MTNRNAEGHHLRSTYLDAQIIEPTPEQKRRAALFACESATDTDDARELLGALGALGLLGGGS